MATAIHELLAYTRRHVTPDDIRAYAPMDPGYSRYVAAFTDILQSGALPPAAQFSITETIELTHGADPEQNPPPRNFRRFRTFTNAVGLALYGPHEAGGINYLPIGLIDDAWSLQDRDLLARLLPAFAEFHLRLHQGRSEEAPFLLLGMILLHFMIPGTHQAASALAQQLIADEQAIECHRDAAFLWGCTHFETQHPRWTRYIRDHLAPVTPTLTLLRQALLADR
jgi:hypothetical protein